jgi:metal-sulfur cluster biosynthetic enzyme
MTKTVEMPAEDEIRRIVNGIGDPCSVASGTPMGLDEMGIVKSVEVTPDGVITVWLRITSPSCYQLGYFSTSIQDRLGNLPGVTKVVVHSDKGLEWLPSMIDPAAQRRRVENLARKGVYVSMDPVTGI